MPQGSRTLLRYSQIRRTDRVDSPSDDSSFLGGRYFQADCLASDVIGHFVYVTGPSVSSVPQVNKVDIRVQGRFPAVGMILEKSSFTRCLVVVFGEVAVSPAVLVPGKTYWIGLDGKLTATFPAAGVGECVATQVLGYAIDTGRLLINPERRPTILVG